MSTTATTTELWGMLDTLANDLEATRFRVAPVGERAGDVARRSLLADIRQYFGPRLSAPGAPIVVAVLGPSGVGVSAVVNALVGKSVSPAGILRPTTKSPIMWAPYTARGRWWEESKHRFGVDSGTEVVLGDIDSGDREWVVIDVPAALGPGESIDLAARADLCVFVNSPSRYADAEAAALAIGLFERGVPTWYALNKLPDDVALRGEILEAYAGLLHSWNLIDAPSPGLIETAIATDDGDVGDGDLAGLRRSLERLADDDEHHKVLNDAIAARLAAVSVRAEEVAESIEEERDTIMELVTLAQNAYAEETDRVVAHVNEGGFAPLTSHSSWSEAAVDLSGVATRRAGLAAQRAAAAWEADPAGRLALADGGAGLRRHGEHAAFESQGLLEAWLEELGDLAATALTSKRMSARRRAKLAGLLWPLVVDPDRDPPRRLRRKLGASLTDVASEGRTRLGKSLAAALERDGARFEAFLGPPPDVARLGRIITTASLLGVLQPIGLERQPGPSWGEPEAARVMEMTIVVGRDDTPAGDGGTPSASDEEHDGPPTGADDRAAAPAAPEREHHVTEPLPEVPSLELPDIGSTAPSASFDSEPDSGSVPEATGGAAERLSDEARSIDDA